MSSPNVHLEVSNRVGKGAPFKDASLAPGKSVRRKRDRFARQEGLIEAAKKLFASKGYEVTTTREIAAAAGCAEGLIHRYFKGKAGLLSAVIEYWFSREVLDLRHQLRPAPTFSQEFLQLVGWEIERMREDRDFLCLIIPRALLDPGIRKVINRSVLSRAEAIRRRLQHFEQCKRLPAEEVDTLVQAIAMLGLSCGFLRPEVLGQDHRSAKKAAALTAKAILRGLKT
jgi:TetR/AcrR family transcriptional regulator, regulator of cefoperazone and chloramphenicol sensitivity